jgi:X-Pro dipeptidyl-peptidase
VLTRGWQDAAHHVSLRFVTPLRPGRWYSVTVPLQPTDQRIATGHVLGLIVQASDNEYSTPQSTGATIHLDLRGSALNLPLVGRLPTPGTTAPVVAATPASPNRVAPPRFRPLLPDGTGLRSQK